MRYMRFGKFDPASRHCGLDRIMNLFRRHTVYSPDDNIEPVQPAAPQRIAYPPAEVYDPRVHYRSEPPAYRQPPAIDYIVPHTSMPEHISMPGIAHGLTDAQQIELAIDAVKNGDVPVEFPDPLDVPPQFPGFAAGADPYADSWDASDEWHHDPFHEPDPLMDNSLEQMVDGPVEPPEMGPMDGPVEDPYKPMG